MRHRTVGVFLRYCYCMCWAAYLPACLAFQATYTGRASCGLSIATWRFAPNNNEPQQSSFTSPHADMAARDVVTTCMEALLQNDNPRKNAGLNVCFDFSSDRCRAALGGNVEDFILYASNPTFGSMMNANEYIVLSVGPIIVATMTRGAMQTVLVKVTPSKGDHRTFLWYVYSCMIDLYNQRDAMIFIAPFPTTNLWNSTNATPKDDATRTPPSSPRIVASSWMHFCGKCLCANLLINYRRKKKMMAGFSPHYF